MTPEALAEMKHEVTELRHVVYGNPPGKSGLAHIVDNIGTTLYGSQRVPGIVEEVSAIRNQVTEIKNAVWRVCAIASIVMVLVQIGMQVLFKLWH